MALASQAGEVVYDNLTNPLGSFLGGFGAYDEVADDVILSAGSARLFESATIAYTGSNFDGDETLTLTLYALDGAPTTGSFGFATPGTVLYSSTLPIIDGPDNRITFVDPTESVLLPDHFVVGLAFGGVDFDPTGGGSDAGGLLFDPPSRGSSFEDFWLKGFGGDPDWALFTFGGNPPINLGIQITAVPEPGTWISIGGLALLVGAVFARRVRGS